MGALRIDVSAKITGLKRFVDKLPKLEMAFLARVGARGRGLLRKDLLSGQALNLKSSERDSRGRYLISNKVSRIRGNLGITFGSYPLNLFERGRTLRNGKKEPGKHILRIQFKNLLNAKLQGYATSAMRKTIDKEAAKV